MTDGKKWFEKITCTGIFVFTDVSRMLEKKEKKKKKENTKNNRIYSYNKVHFRNAQWNML